MYLRHEKLVQEMELRGYNHQSPLDEQKASGSSIQNSFVDTYSKQLEILKGKKCKCNLDY